MKASFNLQEVTIHHVEKNGTIIIILLDSTKAFDTVPHDGLRVKLFDYGAAGHLWLLLDNMYNNFPLNIHIKLSPPLSPNIHNVQIPSREE
jgi:hypothetical protein